MGKNQPDNALPDRRLFLRVAMASTALGISGLTEEVDARCRLRQLMHRKRHVHKRHPVQEGGAVSRVEAEERKRLEARMYSVLLDTPTQETYNIGNELLTFHRTDFAAFILDEDNMKQQAFILKTLDLPTAPTVHELGKDSAFFMAPVEQLIQETTLNHIRELSSENQLPYMSRVWSHNNRALIPMRTISVKPTEGKREDVVAFAKNNGLILVDETGNVLQFKMDSKASSLNPFELVRKCNALASVEWSEPDFIFQLSLPEQAQ
jgi:hypothetical protein